MAEAAEAEREFVKPTQTSPITKPVWLLQRADRIVTPFRKVMTETIHDYELDPLNSHVHLLSYK